MKMCKGTIKGVVTAFVKHAGQGTKGKGPRTRAQRALGNAVRNPFIMPLYIFYDSNEALTHIDHKVSARSARNQLYGISVT